MTRIALDAMGGDNAPHEIVVGAVESAAGLGDVQVLLVGQLSKIQEVLDSLPKDLKNDAQKAIESGKLEIVHAPDNVEMDESPVDAVRRKKDCSINVAMRLVKEGRADAFVSAGNSGAVATSAIFNLGRIPGVMRPAIATVLPTRIPRRPILVLDAGANMDCHPDWLVQFAIMGNAYSKAVIGRTTPKVGLVSIGTEDCKGNEMTKQTFPLLKEVRDINFVGNIEGHDLFKGQMDVAVCDGFVGNVLLKQAESLYHIMKKMGVENRFLDGLNYESVGGTPVLGINAPVIIGHGCSTPLAIKNMILQTEKTIKADLATKLKNVFNITNE
jgi:glycerol-3-phosphate acyltransferase PlsX